MLKTLSLEIPPSSCVMGRHALSTATGISLYLEIMSLYFEKGNAREEGIPCVHFFFRFVLFCFKTCGRVFFQSSSKLNKLHTRPGGASKTTVTHCYDVNS